ncbi:hypothetical protein H6F98_19555 [Microcoleus sp. FACHB-SPT15]|uniref:hypothetical protein n=1 Tax=Microcoleus sp. FACHB-SPT15 TaxID=2692830 RepID=UPI0017852D7D|nr:hypothetical protein [Microcoleus sp. FACHB-SPT15]MBD1807624.1 hypothetical protein [Microcoleus sp. FACHB-SPT15]
MTQMETKTSETRASTGQALTKSRPIIILLSLIILIGFLAFRIEIAFPATPSIHNTFPLTQPAPQEIGSYDVLG